MKSIMSGGYCTQYKQWQLKVTVILFITRICPFYH